MVMLKILLSRTDKIGDVMLTLPMAGILKSIYPECKIFFLGRNYTEEVIRCSKHVDVFIDWDKLNNHLDPIDELKKFEIDIAIHVFPNKKFAKLAKLAQIPIRIGTNRRWFHFLYCNRLVNLSRKNSLLHEAQLNILLLRTLKNEFSKNLLKTIINLKSISDYYGFTEIESLSENHIAAKLIHPNKINLILHPKSGGSAHEWPMENFIALINSLPKEKFNIFFTGTGLEKEFIDSFKIKDVHNVSGLMNLREFVQFIKMCDALVAGSTGPLHIAAALGKHTIGLYPFEHSMHPRRWGALGEKSENLIMNDTTIEDISKRLLNEECI